MVSLNSKKQLLDFCQKLDAAIDNVDFLDSKRKLLKCLSTNINNKNIIIPIVGTYSSGKSTLLNSLLQTDILPTSNFPETSFAMEIKYSEDERIIAVCENGHQDIFNIKEIHNLSDKSDQYIHLEVFLNIPILKELSPLILVDMPGFNSSSKAHNKAINEYLLKGCHFVILSPSNVDAIDMSLIDRVNEIKSINKDFDFVLSKGDLIPSEKLAEIISENEMNLDKYCNLKKNFYTTSRTNSPAQFISILEHINPNYLFTNYFRNSFDDICNDILSQINLITNTINSQCDDAENILNVLNATLKEVEDTTKDQLHLYRGKYTQEVQDAIQSYITKDFAERLPLLTKFVLNNNKEALLQHIYNIMRQSFLSTLNVEFEKIANAINNEILQSLSNLNAQMFYLNFDDNFIESIKRRISYIFDSKFDCKENNNQNTLILNLVFKILNENHNNSFNLFKEEAISILDNVDIEADDLENEIATILAHDVLDVLLSVVLESIKISLDHEIANMIKLISSAYITELQEVITLINNISEDVSLDSEETLENLDKLSTNVLEINEMFLKTFN